MDKNETNDVRKGMDKKKSLWINTSSLFVIQIANYILPFLLIPYLTHVLGVKLFGIVAFGMAIVQIACIVTDYGFNLSATYQISKNRENQHLVNKIIGAVFFCKSTLLIMVIICLTGYILIQAKFENHRMFLGLMILPIIGQSYQPIWFFQGIERMIYITIYMLCSRILYLILVIVMVSSANNYYWVAIANGIAHISAAIIGVFMIFKLGYKIKWPGWVFVKETFLNSTDFFWSRAAVATYSAGGVFFLGLVGGASEIAYYSAAEQLYKGAKAVFEPISQSLYPHMAKHKNLPLFIKVLTVCTILSIIGVLIGLFFGNWIITLFFGDNFENTYPILVVFLFTFLVTTPSILLGYPFLGALGDSKLANKSVMIAGIVQIFILLLFFVLGISSGFWVAFSVFFVEIMVLAMRIFWSSKYFFK